MARLSILKDGSGTNCAENCQGNRSFGSRLGDGENEKKDSNNIVLVNFHKICHQIDTAFNESLQAPTLREDNTAFNESLQAPTLREDSNEAGDDVKKTTCQDNADKGKVAVSGADGQKIHKESEKSVVQEKTITRKRKHGDMEKMLAWMHNVARNPCDLSTGKLPECSRWKENKGKESWSLALLARQARLKRKYEDSNNDCPSSQKKKQRMHPYMYDECSADRHPEGIRTSRRSSSIAKTHLCSCCKPSLPQQAKLPSPAEPTDMKNNSKNEKVEVVDHAPSIEELEEKSAVNFGVSRIDLPITKQVNVGPKYQAIIPPWTGEASESDSRWLGTQVWPPQNLKNSSVVAHDSVGKGRIETCNCRVSSSVECIRFHTAENNIKLKKELGHAFYQWKFDTMGELVSLSWSADEEMMFKKEMIAKRLSLGKENFLKKQKKELIDYYFNVFLQMRRRYQNRTTPMEINSDDEIEFGTVGGLFGESAIYPSGLSTGSCSLNEQCWDFFNNEQGNEKRMTSSSQNPQSPAAAFRVDEKEEKKL